MLRITTLPESVQSLVQQGELSTSHARTIAVAENPEDLAHKIIEKNLSVADTDKLVKNAPRAKNKRIHIQKTIDTKTLKNMESKIKNILGADTKIIEKRGGAGQITIFFNTRTQLFELIEKLSK